MRVNSAFKGRSRYCPIVRLSDCLIVPLSYRPNRPTTRDFQRVRAQSPSEGGTNGSDGLRNLAGGTIAESKFGFSLGNTTWMRAI